jgi:hypothetical protein
MLDLNPLIPARQDAEKVAKRAWYRAVDFAKTYVTVALVKQVAIGAVALVAAALNFPAFAFAIVAIALAVSSVFAIYLTKLLKAQDREVRWAWIDGKRAAQREVSAKIAVDTVTLALMGERSAPGRLRNAPPELRSALAFHQHRLQQAEARAEAAEAVKEGTATDVQRRALKSFQRSGVARPKGPALEPIKRRREALDAERAALEAEIKSLSTAENIAKAMEAAEVQGARRTKRERQNAAREADQAARERLRAGKQPTAVGGGSVINLAIKDAAELQVKSRGGDSVGLNVFGDNDAARGLYESAGYEITSAVMRKELTA